MKRVKLTSEWVTWYEAPNGMWFLKGAADYVAALDVRPGTTPYVRVYTRVWWMPPESGTTYGGGIDHTCDFGITVDEAMRICVDVLVDVGLIDPIWWLSQCLDE